MIFSFLSADTRGERIYKDFFGQAPIEAQGKASHRRFNIHPSHTLTIQSERCKKMAAKRTSNDMVLVVLVAIVAIAALLLVSMGNRASGMSATKNVQMVTPMQNVQSQASVGLPTPQGMVAGPGSGSCAETSDPDGSSSCTGSCSYGTCQTGNVGRCVCKYP